MSTELYGGLIKVCLFHFQLLLCEWRGFPYTYVQPYIYAWPPIFPLATMPQPRPPLPSAELPSLAQGYLDPAGRLA